MRIRCTQERAGVGAVRASVFSILGGIAEPPSYIRQRRTDSAPGAPATLTFEVVTGIVDEAPFKPHGHTVRVSVVTA